MNSHFTFPTSLHNAKMLSKMFALTHSLSALLFPIILLPCQNFMFFDLLIFASQVGVKWHLIVILIGISLITKEVEILSYYQEPLTEISVYAY